MRSEEWSKIEELLDAALELESDERQEFLDGLDSPDLRREVESLLACEKNTNGFLDAPALALSADFFDQDRDERVGQTVGNYRIIHEIGRGGMGTVFLAERADGEFEHKVALKVVRRSFADTELKRRFRRERQILASLNHPNIARLMDGGVSDDGEPYLVMEYVEGARIDNYCQEGKLSTREELRLFLEVCRGVSYAHQHLVVHRDIKPSNILVTKDSVPKLLDFGIAKLIDEEQTGEHTRTEMRAFTLEYASPEQVSGAPVTTASDVYSLGVLLRDLLHGTKRSPDKKIASVELENIVAMARREDPARRYASAVQLAEDVQRYLDGLPVRAQKDSFSYRAGKFIKRNKIGVAAAAIVLATLIGGIIATVWQARRATHQARIAAEQRDRARLEAAKAARINQFLQSIFASANPHWYSSGFGQRGEIKVVDVLEQAGRRIDAELKNEPEIRAELHHTVGTTYLSLGRHEPAQTHFRAALDAYRGLYGEQHPEVAEALYYLAASVHASSDFPAAIALFRQALEMFRAVDPNNTNVPYLLADFSSSLNRVGERVAAEQAAREGLDLARQRYGDEHVLTNGLVATLGFLYMARGDLSQAETYFQTALANLNRTPNGKMSSPQTLEGLGNLAMYKGEFGRAEKYLGEALDISRQTHNETHPTHINILLWLAEIHYVQGAYADAEREAASALDLLRRSAFRKSQYQLRGLILLSLTHARTNRPARAAAYLRDALALLDDVPYGEKFASGILLAEALVLMKREDEAKTRLTQNYEYLARTHSEQHPEAVRARKLLEKLGAPGASAFTQER
ncbi:MAG TPA: protein kinase [Pyrinomonadaceae bacterium]|nr:protein kinase [Pyrinomonadaceae bacterium]